MSGRVFSDKVIQPLHNPGYSELNRSSTFSYITSLALGVSHVTSDDWTGFSQCDGDRHWSAVIAFGHKPQRP